MAEGVVGIRESDVPRIKRLLNAFEGGTLTTQGPPGRRPFQSPVMFEFGVTDAATTGGSSATISIHVSTGDTGDNEVAFPVHLGPTPADSRVKIWRHQRSGDLYFSIIQPPSILHALVNESTGVNSTDPTFAVDGMTVLSPVGSASTGTTLPAVINILRFPSTNNAEVLIFRNGASTTYYGIPKPARTTCP